MWTIERRKEDITDSTSVWVDIDANEFFAVQTKQKVEEMVPTSPAPQRNFFSISQFFLTTSTKTKKQTTTSCNCNLTENIGNLPYKGTTSCVICGEKEFRICIIYHSVSPLVIAMDDNKENILSKWRFIQSQLHIQLKMLEGEEKREQVKNRSWHTVPGKKSLTSSLPQFIILKTIAYLRDQEDLQLDQIAKEIPYPEGTSDFFHSSFGMDEPLHHYYMGHLWKDKLYRGGLYVTDKAICFVSLLHGIAFLLPLSAIVSIEMDYIPSILSPTILIQFGKDQRYPFIPIDDSDQCLRSLKQIWRSAMNTIVKKTQEALKIASYGVDSVDERYRNISRCTGSFSSTSINTNDRQTQSSFLSFSDFSLKYNENLLGVTYYHCPIFENPIRKIFIISEEKCYFAFNTTKNPLRGICYMSVSCYFFHSDEPLQPSAITMPVKEILSITREEPFLSGYETLKFLMKNDIQVYFALQPKGDGANIFFQTWNAKSNQTDITQEHVLSRRHYSILALKQEFFRDHIKEGITLINNWRDYLERYGRGICTIRSKQTIDLIRKGIPNQLRAEIWQISCGSLYFLQYSNEKSYKLILEDHIDSPYDKTVKSEIIRDLHRTIPEHPFFQLEEGREMLYRILTAFCWKNPHIGYTQSMNVLAGVFLLYMSEEEAFWMLCTVCEHILPGYYTESMSGNLLDQQVISAIIAEYLPHLFLKFQHYSIDVELFTVPWFLCLFIRRIPWNTSLRVLDWFFSEGSRVLFIITLSILKMFEKEIINLLEKDQFLELFRTVVYENCHADQLFQIAVEVYDQQITYEKLTYLRNAQMKIRNFVNRNSSF